MMRKGDWLSVFLVVVVVFMVLCFVGFVAGVVMFISGATDRGSSLAYSCGLPVMAMLMSAVNARKRR